MKPAAGTATSRGKSFSEILFAFRIHLKSTDERKEECGPFLHIPLTLGTDLDEIDVSNYGQRSRPFPWRLELCGKSCYQKEQWCTPLRD